MESLNIELENIIKYLNEQKRRLLETTAVIMTSPNIELENITKYLNEQKRRLLETRFQEITETNSKNLPFLENWFSKSNDVFFHPPSGLKFKCKKNLTDAISLQCISNTNLPIFQVSGNLKKNNIHAALVIFPGVQLDIHSKLILNSVSWSFRGRLDEKISNLETTMRYSENDFSTRLTLGGTARSKPPQMQYGYINKNLSVTSFSFQLVKRLNNCWMLGVHLGSTPRFGICKQFQKSEVGVFADKDGIKLFYRENIMQNFHIGIQQCIDSKKLFLKIGIRTDTESGQWRCFVSTNGILGLYYQTMINNFGIKLSCLLKNGYPQLGCGLKYLAD